MKMLRLALILLLASCGIANAGDFITPGSRGIGGKNILGNDLNLNDFTIGQSKSTAAASMGVSFDDRGGNSLSAFVAYIVQDARGDQARSGVGYSFTSKSTIADGFGGNFLIGLDDGSHEDSNMGGQIEVSYVSVASGSTQMAFLVSDFNGSAQRMMSFNGETNVVRFGGTSETFFEFENIDNGTSGSTITLIKDSTTPAADDLVADTIARGRNSAAAFFDYGSIQFNIQDPTSGSELSSSFWYIASGGANFCALGMSGDDLQIEFSCEDNQTATFSIKSTSGGATGAALSLASQSPTPAVDDQAGAIDFVAKNDGGSNKVFGLIQTLIIDPTAASEDGKLVFNVITAGTATDELTLTGAALYPATSDGLALGDTTHQYSDLFLAEGGVVNWDNGDVTITQVNNVLTFAGATTRYEFDANLTPVSSDGAALGTTGLQFSDAFLAEGAVINWDNGDQAITQTGDVLTFTGGTQYVINHTASLTTAGVAGMVQVNGTTSALGSININEYNTTDGTTFGLNFYKSGDAAIATATVVASGESLGAIQWYGAQQTGTFSNQTIAASVFAEVDTTVTSGASADMPGRIKICTTADGAGTCTTRLTIDSAGLATFNNNVTLGTSNSITFGTAEIGAASDTTLSRPGAGRLAIEGNELLQPTTQAAQETHTSNILGVTPGTQQFHASAAKVWGNTTGAGTPVLASTDGTGQYNMTSITDTNTGRLTVTINVDFSTATYTCAFGATTTDSTTAVKILAINTKAAGSFEIDSYSAVTPTLSDVVRGFDWVCYGDQ